MNTVSDSENWPSFWSVNKDFSIKAPAGWSVSYPTPDAHLFQVVSPNADIVISLSAYGQKAGATIRDFVNYRYSCVDRIYQAIGDEYSLDHGFYRIFQDVVSSEEKKTDYLVAGVEQGAIVVSFGIVAPYKSVQDERRFYEEILSSVTQK